VDPNSHEALLRRRETARLTWRGPALMLFTRAACAVGAQALVAAVLARRASPTSAGRCLNALPEKWVEPTQRPRHLRGSTMALSCT